ncbi:hypothetical protein HPB47_006105 [Ixodes persulcatus]|uniref:Uncharacterized protein n=1 Tax=Ixodes persulcatus TaxID=34615 RepID=A0AC60PB70_IXOPE|nr:hypothetical protein HPB47_006105 [Ixodes persulcatus]
MRIVPALAFLPPAEAPDAFDELLEIFPSKATDLAMYYEDTPPVLQPPDAEMVFDVTTDDERWKTVTKKRKPPKPEQLRLERPTSSQVGLVSPNQSVSELLYA